MNQKITKLQGFNAISMLFDIYYINTLSDDLGGILGSMSFLQDGTTADSAIWEVWIEFLDKILEHKNIQDKTLIDSIYVFIAIKPFLEYFFGTDDLSEEIKFFIKNAEYASHEEKIDPNLWRIWKKCIADVLSLEDSRDYLTFIVKD